MSDPSGGVRAPAGSVRQTLEAYAAAEPTLSLLVILGSASRGDAGGAADFEIGFLADPGFDALTFRALAASVLDLENVAIADLARSPTNAFRAAREGALVHERTPGRFDEFRERAIHHWCELAPVLNAAYDRLEAAPPAKRAE